MVVMHVCCESIAESELTPTQLPILLKKFNGISKRWESIGMKLSLDCDRLRDIKLEYKDDPKQCMEGVLTQVLANVSLTWRDLCNCLRSDEVGCSEIADEIPHWLSEEKGI